VPVSRIAKDPTEMWQPWVGFYFHLGPSEMINLTVHKFIEMHDIFREQQGDG